MKRVSRAIVVVKGGIKGSWILFPAGVTEINLYIVHVERLVPLRVCGPVILLLLTTGLGELSTFGDCTFCSDLQPTPQSISGQIGGHPRPTVLAPQQPRWVRSRSVLRLVDGNVLEGRS
jgi:hypothetical protein